MTKQVTVQEEQLNVQEEQVKNQDTTKGQETAKSRKTIISSLIKAGAKPVKGLTIKNVNITPMDEYIRVSFTLDKEIDAYRSENSVDYSIGTSNVLFTSAYTIAAILKDNENAAFVANHILENPTTMQVLLSYAKIDILQEEVAQGQEYTNPFASNPTPVVFKHDTIINHVVNIEFNQRGLQRLDMLAAKMMGF